MEQVNERRYGRILLSWILAFTILVSPPAYSDCSSPVAPIQQGEVAACTGYLFSPDAESRAYKDKQLLDLEKSENEVLEQRLKLYMDATTNLTKEIASRDSSESYIRFLYLLVGVVGTGYIAANINR